MDYAFSDTDELPLSMVSGTGALKRKIGLGKGSAAVEAMIKCFEELPEDVRSMLAKDAARTGVIVGRDLKAAAMQYKKSEADDDAEEEDTEYASLEMDDDLTGRKAI